MDYRELHINPKTGEYGLLDYDPRKLIKHLINPITKGAKYILSHMHLIHTEIKESQLEKKLSHTYNRTHIN